MFTPTNVCAFLSLILIIGLFVWLTSLNPWAGWIVPSIFLFVLYKLYTQPEKKDDTKS